MEPSRANWTNTLTGVFIRVLMAEMVAANCMEEKSLRSKNWKTITSNFQLHAKIEYSRNQLQNLRSNLKREYFIFVALKSQPGFEWDPETKMVRASEEVWGAYLKEHQEARKYHNKPLAFHDELEKIFTGSFAADSIPPDDESVQTEPPAPTTPAPETENSVQVFADEGNHSPPIGIAADTSSEQVELSTKASMDKPVANPLKKRKVEVNNKFAAGIVDLANAISVDIEEPQSNEAKIAAIVRIEFGTLSSSDRMRLKEYLALNEKLVGPFLYADAEERKDFVQRHKSRIQNL